MFHKKLGRLETYIIRMFQSRTDTIPGIFEISKEYLTKHDDIFKEALRLKKTEFSLLEGSSKLSTILEVEGMLHHEINFIFKVCNKHPKLLKNGNFIYMRDVVIKKSKKLGDSVSLYKKMVYKYNSLIQIKNYSIVGLLLPIRKKTEI